MNKNQYRKLGDYIAPAMEKNVGLKIHLSQGICNNKYFQTPRQVAQDSENDQIVRRGQFAFNKATTRNGEKISIAYRDGEDCTVSSAYQVFYIKDEEQLNPYYLMMWFKRPEFDRYARFKSHGSAHEFFTYEEMCNVLLPVPSIEEQRRIVSEYQTVEQRIQNNEQLIKKLEETAQAIYNHTFVEGIDEENLPKGWKVTTMAQICDFAYGKMPKEEDVVDNGIPVYCGYAVTKYYKYASHTKKTIVVIARGDAGSGEVKMSPNEFFLSNLGIAIMPKDENLKWYLYYHLLTKDTYSLRTGSAQAQVTINSIEPFEVIIPPQDKIMYFSNIVESLSKYKDNLLSENSHLNSLLSLLTSKLS